jgi:fibronectin type 3 domain-containing protein
MKHMQTPTRFVRVLAAFAAAFLLLGLAVTQAGVIVNVVETGGDNEATDTIVAQWTGRTFVNGIANEPIPGSGATDPYTVGYFGNGAPCYVDRNHRYTNAWAALIPAYLDGREYIMCGNDNRDNANYRLDVTVSAEVRVYLLIDNRLNDGNNADPPTFTATNMQWVVNENWTPVLTGANHTGNPAYPDEVGIDEGADGSINQYFSVYVKTYPAGTFQLKQPDSAGRNMYGVVVEPTAPPAVPTGLTVVVTGDGFVRLGWTAAAGASSYNVQRSESAGGPYTVVGNVMTSTFQDTGLINGLIYYYVVTAVNALGESAPSSEVQATPGPGPTGLTAVGGTNQISLTWDAFGGATGYTVRRSDVSGGPYTTLASGVADPTYTDTGLPNGRRYYYVVIAELSGGVPSGYSAEASGVTAPSTPAGLVAQLFAAKAIRLYWDRSTEVINSYTLQVSTDGINFTDALSTNAPTTNGVAVVADFNTLYSLRVRAVNAAGPSAYSTVVTMRTPLWGVNVNFANATNGSPANDPAPTPPGYLQDVGELFGDRGNGWNYGWATLGGTNITTDGRWRKSANSPDLRYDTFNHLQKGVGAGVKNARWEIELPNGFYQVRIVAGDANAVDSVFQFEVEGLPTATYTPATGAWWGDFTSFVTVSDGRLTVDSGPSASNNKISFIDIYRAIRLVDPVYDATTPSFSASFATVSGVDYKVKYRDTLPGLPATWTTLTTVTGDGTLKSFTDPGPLPAMRFYQVVVE